MPLADLPVREYMALLASGDPTPGGGSAAALIGAAGAALTSMAGALTKGRAAYAENAAFVDSLLEQTRLLREEFLNLAEEDAAVFNEMNAAYKLPKNTPEDKAARSGAIQAALAGCAAVPYKTVGLCGKALGLTAQAVGKTNMNVASDLGVAALCLKAAAQAAWLNVSVNLGAMRDAAFAAEMRAGGEILLEKAVNAADGVYGAVLKICGGGA